MPPSGEPAPGASPDPPPAPPGGLPPDPLPPGYAALWGPAAAGRRGPRRGLTLAAIAAAGIGLADAEGLAAVSMARVAAALGVSPMALYRYVAGKDELVAVMCDAAMGPPPAPGGAPPGGTAPERAAPQGTAPQGTAPQGTAPQGTGGGEPADGWRTALAAWFRAQLAGFVRHPWMAEAVGSAAVGPNRLAWIETGLATVAATPLTVDEKASVVGHVSLYALAEAQVAAAAAAQQRAARAAQAGADGGPGPGRPGPGWPGPGRPGTGRPGPGRPGTGRPARAPAAPAHPALIDYPALLARLSDPDRHPRIAEALRAGAFDDGEDGEWSEFGLGLLLDGVAALVERAGRPGAQGAGR